MNRTKAIFRLMFDQTQDLSLPNLLYRYIICGNDNSLVSSSHNLGTKSWLKKYNMCLECSARKGNKITSNYLLIGVKNRNKKEAKS
jgi:hypothetical protein